MYSFLVFSLILACHGAFGQNDPVLCECGFFGSLDPAAVTRTGRLAVLNSTNIPRCTEPECQKHCEIQGRNWEASNNFETSFRDFDGKMRTYGTSFCSVIYRDMGLVNGPWTIYSFLRMIECDIGWEITAHEVKEPLCCKDDGSWVKCGSS